MSRRFPTIVQQWPDLCPDCSTSINSHPVKSCTRQTSDCQAFGSVEAKLEDQEPWPFPEARWAGRE